MYSMKFIEKVSHYLSVGLEKWIINDQQKKEILWLIKAESSNIGFMKILSIIGVICIGIGVILIISSNWSEFPNFIKLLLSILLPIASLGIWYFFIYVQTELKIIGNAFILLWGILLWAAIALIGQIYNLDGTVGSLLLMWFTISLPLVFIFRLKTLAILSTALIYGVIFYYCTEEFFSIWRDLKYILAVFTVISSIFTIWCYFINKMLSWEYNFLLMPVCIISLKILFFVLFLGTLDNELMFLWENLLWILMHNLLFLGSIIFVIWWANKNHEILLRHSAFVWIGIYIFAKYILLFSWYLQAWVFFIVAGLFVITLVYSFIKINIYLKNQDTTPSL